MKRIDLNQYEGHTLEGLTPELLDEAGFEQSNAKLIADAPEVLQALKEAYDEIDKLQKALSIINSTHYRKE